jgi:nucleolar protein 12
VEIDPAVNGKLDEGNEAILDGQAVVLGDKEDATETATPRKRKRKARDDDIEDLYMQRLAREEAKEAAARQKSRSAKKQKIAKDPNVNAEDVVAEDMDSGDAISIDEDEEASEASSPPPQHETQAPSSDAIELDKAGRTIFLANVSTLAIKSKTSRRILLDHLSSFLPSLPEEKIPHKVESLRFRSTAYATSSVPRKAAFVKKELMDATTKCTNAYAVYSTALAAREAAKRLNGTVVLERHVRVDSVAHPSKTDHRRCVFVGNLGFVDDESMMRAAEAPDGAKKPRKPKAPADVEEGLWRQFSQAGTVESVRVVRDKTTRVGKGFAYVQFTVSSSIHRPSYPKVCPRPSCIHSTRYRANPRSPFPGLLSRLIPPSPVTRTANPPPTAYQPG